MEFLALRTAAMGKKDDQVRPAILRADPFCSTIVEDKDVERCLANQPPQVRLSVHRLEVATPLPVSSGSSTGQGNILFLRSYSPKEVRHYHGGHSTSSSDRQEADKRHSSFGGQAMK